MSVAFSDSTYHAQQVIVNERENDVTCVEQEFVSGEVPRAPRSVASPYSRVI